jgi:hypothetical protein
MEDISEIYSSIARVPRSRAFETWDLANPRREKKIASKLIGQNEVT